jgi:hypothetical protein
MSDPMGKQHYTEPVTDSDEVMSKRHKDHRKEVDMIKDHDKKMKMSMKYNLAHAKEHIKAMKDARKEMKKGR